jgi:hypothetical protein
MKRILWTTGTVLLQCVLVTPVIMISPQGWSLNNIVTKLSGDWDLFVIFIISIGVILYCLYPKFIKQESDK